MYVYILIIDQMRSDSQWSCIYICMYVCVCIQWAGAAVPAFCSSPSFLSSVFSWLNRRNYLLNLLAPSAVLPSTPTPQKWYKVLPFHHSHSLQKTLGGGGEIQKKNFIIYNDIHEDLYRNLMISYLCAQQHFSPPLSHVHLTIFKCFTTVTLQ